MTADLGHQALLFHGPVGVRVKAVTNRNTF